MLHKRFTARERYAAARILVERRVLDDLCHNLVDRSLVSAKLERADTYVGTDTAGNTALAVDRVCAVRK